MTEMELPMETIYEKQEVVPQQVPWRTRFLGVENCSAGVRAEAGCVTIIVFGVIGGIALPSVANSRWWGAEHRGPKGWGEVACWS